MITQNRVEYINQLDDGIIRKNNETLLQKLELLHGKLENELSIEDIEALNPNKRGYPKYMKGTFDENGLPNNPVTISAILSTHFLILQALL